MAQRRIIELIDDLDETIITDGGTHAFSLDGAAYEIDLSSANAAKLHDALAPFITAGRRTGRAPSNRTPSRSRSRSTGDLNAIRSWARDNGYTVSDRGRIAANIVAAYNEA
ncbi:Lsr2 family protein [Microbacterium sp. ISL-103]|uniref:histone-like nucleoid-structuring protein Lsr2 n=1 Tax=Microbacterium sp. ISL-103 TaxID=2819156 RepID=UPI001BE7D9F2|nr:Lsr2 family protein [Microbacterium sp. ISL-103]MBT2474878.1 Lsr2 family protein [Microbacterium sp. ISL-103]